jgi:hypothetical protein
MFLSLTPIHPSASSRPPQYHSPIPSYPFISTILYPKHSNAVFALSSIYLGPYLTRVPSMPHGKTPSAQPLQVSVHVMLI